MSVIEKFDTLLPRPGAGKRILKSKLLTALGGSPFPANTERLLERKILLAAAGGGGGGGPTDTEALSGFTAVTHATAGGSESQIGFQFTTSAQVTITNLGCWRASVNVGTETLQIMNGAQATLASVVINFSTAISEAMNYVPLGTPLVLPAGTYYCFRSKTGGDLYYDGGGGGNGVNVGGFASPITLVQSGYLNGSGILSTAALNCDYCPTNFKFHL